MWTENGRAFKIKCHHFHFHFQFQFVCYIFLKRLLHTFLLLCVSRKKVFNLTFKFIKCLRNNLRKIVCKDERWRRKTFDKRCNGCKNSKTNRKKNHVQHHLLEPSNSHVPFISSLNVSFMCVCLLPIVSTSKWANRSCSKNIHIYSFVKLCGFSIEILWNWVQTLARKRFQTAMLCSLSLYLYLLQLFYLSLSSSSSSLILDII